MPEQELSQSCKNRARNSVPAQEASLTALSWAVGGLQSGGREMGPCAPLRASQKVLFHIWTGDSCRSVLHFVRWMSASGYVCSLWLRTGNVPK